MASKKIPSTSLLQIFYHRDVLQYAAMVENLRASYMEFFS